MKNLLMIFFLIAVSFKLVANENIDEMPSTTLKFSIFKDTIVSGFDTEFRISSGYNLKNISITATSCSVMLKDSEKGIYVVKAPVSSVGKTSVITVTLVKSDGSSRVLEKFSIPIVAMSTENQKTFCK